MHGAIYIWIALNKWNEETVEVIHIHKDILLSESNFLIYFLQVKEQPNERNQTIFNYEFIHQTSWIEPSRDLLYWHSNLHIVNRWVCWHILFLSFRAGKVLECAFLTTIIYFNNVGYQRTEKNITCTLNVINFNYSVENLVSMCHYFTRCWTPAVRILLLWVTNLTRLCFD
jgi:hypothetical protein